MGVYLVMRRLLEGHLEDFSRKDMSRYMFEGDRLKMGGFCGSERVIWICLWDWLEKFFG